MNDFSQLWYLVGSLVLIDIALGTLTAFKHKCLDTEESFNGILKKTGIILVIVLGYMLENATKAPIFRLTCTFYVVYELLSIVEHLGVLGIPLPKVLTQAISVLQQNADEETSTKTP